MADFRAVFGIGRLWCAQCGFWDGLATSSLMEEGPIGLTLQGLPWGLSFWAQ